MKKTLTLAAILLTGSGLWLSTQAQDDAPEKPRPQGQQFGRQGQEKGPRGPGREMIERFDTDGDGVLSQEERETAMESHRQVMQQRLDEAFTEADTDGDGLLTREEFAKVARLAMRRGGPGGPGGEEGAGGLGQRLQERLDTDGDGVISEEEKAAAREKAVERFQAALEAGEHPRMIERFDTDKDGVLSETEKAAALQTFEERMANMDVPGLQNRGEERGQRRNEERGQRRGGPANR